MRRMIGIVVGVFVCAMALCGLSEYSIDRFCDHALHLRTRAIEYMDAGDVQQAEATLAELAAHLNGNAAWLEVLCEHDDLHEIKAEIIDAQASIEFGIEDDFYQAIYRFGEGIEHISDIERMRFSNLY